MGEVSAKEPRTESAIVGIASLCGDSGVNLITGVHAHGPLHSPFGDVPDLLGEETWRLSLISPARSTTRKSWRSTSGTSRGARARTPSRFVKGCEGPRSFYPERSFRVGHCPFGDHALIRTLDFLPHPFSCNGGTA